MLPDVAPVAPVDVLFEFAWPCDGPLEVIVGCVPICFCCFKFRFELIVGCDYAYGY